MVTSVAVVVVALLLTAVSSTELDHVFKGCDVPPQFWCSSEEVARSCQV